MSDEVEVHGCHSFGETEKRQFGLSKLFLDIRFWKAEIAGVMEPASTIIKRLGGEAKVREVTGSGENAPYRWQYPRDRGGTDGLIPQRHHRKLLDFAREQNIPLSAEEFLPPIEAPDSVGEPPVPERAPCP